MDPRPDEIKWKGNEHLCYHGGELKLYFLHGSKTHRVAKLDGSEPYAGLVSASNVEVVRDHSDLGYLVGLAEAQVGYVPVWGYQVINADPKQVHEFFKRNPLVHGCTAQFCSDGKKVVAVHKRGRMTVRLIKDLMEVGFNRWWWSRTWDPRWFYLDGSVIGVEEWPRT